MWRKNPTPRRRRTASSARFGPPTSTGLKAPAPRRRVRTNIQMLQDDKAEEPWFIAMSDTPSLATARTYAKRWGIEAMFSDFKSRGFGLTESQLRSPGKLNRLIMVMAIALYWAVSTGLWTVKQRASQKNEEKSVVVQWFHHSRQA